MKDRQDLGAAGRAIIDANRYMTLGTTDEDGHPWVSPVYYAPDGYTDFYWVSSPDARHSRNLARRPRLSIVIFDSRAPLGAAQAVYLSGVAGELAGPDLDRGLQRAFPGRFPGESAMSAGQLRPPALHRLYRATVSRGWMLDPAGHPIHGPRSVDHRIVVDLTA